MMPPLRQHLVQSDAAQRAIDETLQHLRQEVAGKDDDEGTEERGNELSENLVETLAKALRECRAIDRFLKNHGEG
jgi:hypothetical protein